ncbi:MAG: hypothetical protein AABY11_02735, partial [archaeon]
NNPLSTRAEKVLLEAQAELGVAHSLNVKTTTGETLYARNLDEPTRTVAFSCSGENCCDSVTETCALPLSVTNDRMKANTIFQTHVSARCENITGLHVCQVYFGDVPAQLALDAVIVPETINLNETNEWEVRATLLNTGKQLTTPIRVVATVAEKQIVNGKEEWANILNEEQMLSAISPGDTEAFLHTILIPRAGDYMLTLRAEAEDAGFSETTHTLHATGILASLCQPNLSDAHAPFFDAFDNVCRRQKTCTGCNFTFECLNAWKKYPVSGGASYDETRGEPGFIYVTYPAKEGNVC